MKNKGFTLIELLVTVAIIVILATLIIVNIAQVRMSGRDAKRVADVASIKLALELYKNAKGEYPKDLSEWAAATGATSGLGSIEQTNWALLATDLQGYLSPLPKDPLNKTGYRYYIRIINNGATPSIYTGAIIKTKFESDNNSEKMTDDSCSSNIDYYDVISGYMIDSQKTDLCDAAPDA